MSGVDRWFREDRMPLPALRLESGTIWVDALAAAGTGRVVVDGKVRGCRRHHHGYCVH